MKKVINYKVQKEEWETLKNEAFKKLNAKATIDGFRKEKLQEMYSKEIILDKSLWKQLT